MIPSHRCWVEVDLDCLKNNLSWIRHRVGNERRIMTVVKADAYGHGLKQIAAHLMRSGTDCFGVANLEEAHSIRMTSKDWPILMLGACLTGELVKAVRWGIHLTVSSLDELKKIQTVAELANKTVRVHLKLDTGMGRLGCSKQSLPPMISFIRKSGWIQLAGCYTHFSDVENDTKYTQLQRSMFRSGCRHLPRIPKSSLLIHASNSGALVFDRTIIGNLVRPGLLVYGLIPEGKRKPQHTFIRHMRPALSFHSRITYLKWIKRGESLSYGRTFKAKRMMRVATVGCGYGDGFPLAASNQAMVLIQNQRCPVIGRVTMDQTLVDVTGLDHVELADKVTIIGNQGAETITATEMARTTGTIPWHILTSITYRVPRIYRGANAS